MTGEAVEAEPAVELPPAAVFPPLLPALEPARPAEFWPPVSLPPFGVLAAPPSLLPASLLLAEPATPAEPL